MKVIIRPTEEDMGQVASQIMLGTMYQDRRVNISITAGASPRTTYAKVIDEVVKYPQDFTNVHYYSFDNVPLSNNSDGVTGRDLRNQYFAPAKVAEENIHLMNVEDHEGYMRGLADNGGLDLMVIGLGADGHFCANMPGLTTFSATSYTVALPEAFTTDPGLLALLEGADVPEEIVTMGAPALMKVKRLVLLINGEHKAEAAKTMFESEVDLGFPASILKLHPRFTVVMDEAAAKLL